jgi:hypothetical protein
MRDLFLIPVLCLPQFHLSHFPDGNPGISERGRGDFINLCKHETQPDLHGEEFAEITDPNRVDQTGFSYAGKTVLTQGNRDQFPESPLAV